MSGAELPDGEPEGTPDSVPTKSPDETLRLTDDGLEMPEFLKGYVGAFGMRTPKVTGSFETTDSGLPEGEFWDGIIAEYPEAGDYHADLESGMMALSTDDHPETVFEIIDEREADR